MIMNTTHDGCTEVTITEDCMNIVMRVYDITDAYISNKPYIKLNDNIYIEINPNKALCGVDGAVVPIVKIHYKKGMSDEDVSMKFNEMKEKKLELNFVESIDTEKYIENDADTFKQCCELYTYQSYVAKYGYR